MTLIFCVDESGGMLFCGKRQSRDRILNDYIQTLAGESPLWVTPYTAKLFPWGKPLSHCNGAGYYLVEDGAYDLETAEAIILCHWNRRYPGDVFLDLSAIKAAFRKEKTEELAGSSHEKITVETYRRK